MIAISDIEEARKKLDEVSKAHSRGKKLPVRSCHDCGVQPGEPHLDGCDVERCSVCGFQRLGCGCKGHDKAFSRWTGFWPGELESEALGVVLGDYPNLNDFYGYGFHLVFFVKPKPNS